MASIFAERDRNLCLSLFEHVAGRASISRDDLLVSDLQKWRIIDVKNSKTPWLHFPVR